MVTWPEKPLWHHGPAQESWARSPGSPSGPTSSNDRGGVVSGVLRTQLWHPDLREG